MSEKRLVRTQDDKMLLGVAGGIAQYLAIDPAIVRIAFVLLTLLHGWGLIIYFVMAIIMPVEGSPVSAKANAFDEEEIVIKDA
ncbi:MAG: PspC domain-containing protein [Candidatus Promineifilaceae bacterium]|jgi:phage shock protein C